MQEVLRSLLNSVAFSRASQDLENKFSRLIITNNDGIKINTIVIFSIFYFLFVIYTHILLPLFSNYILMHYIHSRGGACGSM